MSKLIKMFSGKCPHCEKGEVFCKSGNPFLLQMPKMHSHCQECGHRFEKEPGYFFGAMYISYVIAVAEMFAIFVISRLFVTDLLHSFLIMAFISLFLMTINFKYSRLIWMYIFDSKDS